MEDGEEHGEEEDEEEEEEEDEEEQNDQAVRPYFPMPLSQPGRPATDFNFKLFLLDSLRLEAGLFPADAHEPMALRSVDKCSRYCQWLAGAMRERKERHQRAVGRQPATAPNFDTKALFHCCGTALGEKVALGDPIFDCNLDQLRLDLFRNRMVLFGPGGATSASSRPTASQGGW